MPDRYTDDTYDDDRDFRRRDRDVRRDFRDDRRDDSFPPLPSWVEAKLLRDGEQVEWVRGPRFNPFWERYVTHPLLFVFALLFGGLLIATGVAVGGVKSDVLGVCVGAAILLVFGSIFLLGLFSGFFTRLVVTNRRVAIMQGYEVVRNWDLDDLPRSMLRYRAGGQGSPTIDLAAVKTMLGGAPDGFADSKTIMAFSKQLNNIVKRRDDKTR